MNGADGSLDALSAVWRRADWPVPLPAMVPHELEERVRKGSRRMRLTIVLEASVTATVFIVLGLRMAPRLTGSAWLLGLAAVAHTAVVWGVVTWNRRGVWQPVALETAAYLTLLRTRARRRILTARFMAALLAVECGGVLLAVLAMANGHLARWAQVHLDLTFMGAVVFGGAMLGIGWLHASGSRQLAWLREVKKGLESRA